MWLKWKTQEENVIVKKIDWEIRINASLNKMDRETKLGQDSIQTMKHTGLTILQRSSLQAFYIGIRMS